MIDGKWATIGGIICSVGLILGIMILGTRVLQTLGKGIVSLKMSSGFAAQLGSATVTIIGTYFGVPLSTTNLIVMSIIGIGVIDNAYPDPISTNSGYSPNLISNL